jgi:predicted RNA-binding Zn-ribbon protein involved in translation (DUF1610 family)
MSTLRTLLRTTQTFLRSSIGAAHPMTGVSIVHDHCPHCAERTAWRASVLRGYYRCQRCGRDPMAAQDDASAAARRPSFVPEGPSEPAAA